MVGVDIILQQGVHIELRCIGVDMVEHICDADVGCGTHVDTLTEKEHLIFGVGLGTCDGVEVGDLRFALIVNVVVFGTLIVGLEKTIVHVEDNPVGVHDPDTFAVNTSALEPNIVGSPATGSLDEFLNTIVPGGNLGTVVSGEHQGSVAGRDVLDVVLYRVEDFIGLVSVGMSGFVLVTEESEGEDTCNRGSVLPEGKPYNIGSDSGQSCLHIGVEPGAGSGEHVGRGVYFHPW